jgi:hypothetical protein
MNVVMKILQQVVVPQCQMFLLTMGWLIAQATTSNIILTQISSTNANITLNI